MSNLRVACEIVAKYALPTVRSMVAKKLVEEYGFSQVTTAEKLGTTQATISHYINSKRGNKMVEHFESIPMFQSFINKMVEEIKNNEGSSIDVIPMFCKLCELLDKDMIHRLSGERP